jgi:hypothetical protein
MPEADGGAFVATQSSQPRSPFREHSFLGGNVALLDILGRFGSELGVGYLEDILPEAEAAQRAVLQTQTAEVVIQGARRIGTRLEITVDVQNKAGHKFPTGFPSRRAWIHLTVQDAEGATLFESGKVGSDGSISGDDQEQGGGRFEPHYRIIDTPEKVQIYEAVLGTYSGGATTRLTQAARWLKDNRLLPEGYESSGVDDPTSVIGRAALDGDFEGGGDLIQYDADVSGAQGPYTVTVELLYQSVTPIWVEALKAVSSAEAERYVGYVSEVPPETVLISSNQQQVQP